MRKKLTTIHNISNWDQADISVQQDTHVPIDNFALKLLARTSCVSLIFLTATSLKMCFGSISFLIISNWSYLLALTCLIFSKSLDPQNRSLRSASIFIDFYRLLSIFLEGGPLNDQASILIDRKIDQDRPRSTQIDRSHGEIVFYRAIDVYRQLSYQNDHDR